MKLSAIIITIILVSVFATGFLGFYGSILTSNNLTPQQFSRLNNTSDTVTAIERIYNETTEAQNTTSDLTGIFLGPYNLVKGAFNAIMQAFTLPGVFVGMINDLGEAAGVPSYVTSAFVAIIMILIISAIIYLIIGRVF